MILDNPTKRPQIKVELIISFMNKYGITKNKLGGLCNLSRRSVQSVLENKPNFSYNSIYQIAKLMDVSISELLE